MNPLRTIPTLHCGDFTLRAVDPTKDIDSLTKNINDSHIADRVTNVPNPYTVQDAQYWMVHLDGVARHAAGNNGIWLRMDFAIDVAGEYAGSVAFIEIKGNSAQLSYWLGSRFHGKGIMPRAVERVLDFAFDECGFDHIWAEVATDNVASRRVLQKCGFFLQVDAHPSKWKRKDGTIRDAETYVYQPDLRSLTTR